ncbi:multidrug resistance-associated ABC transporter [Panus rudis PR-1116 ss-1]|nr:multidrug resistance-associated ABC transporter [Panus rudis PR-1116 ss-1]
MPPYQLPAAISLVVSAAVSLGTVLLSPPDEGKVKLPTLGSVDEDGEPLKDPFDVAAPEDMIDGEPLEEQTFWARMRIRKLILAFLFAIILAIQAISLGWASVNDDRVGIAIQILHIAFSLYLLVLTSYAVNKDNTAHARLTVHIAVLTLLASAFLGTIAILPSTPNPVTSLLRLKLQYQSISVPSALWYTTVILYIVACAVAITMPRGPKLHFPSERIYSEKDIANTTSRYPDNVSGFTGASVWGILIFSYTTKVVMLGYSSESLEIGDLPIVPVDMRATTIYTNMRAAMRRYKLRIGSWRPKPQSGFELLYRMYRENMRPITIVMFLSAICAVLFYAPAYFLRRIVSYIEADPTRNDRGWGWVYCAGLFFSNVISRLINGQLWSMTTTTLQVLFRVQLNSILFAKTLVRKDIASSAAPTGTEDGAKTSANGAASSQAEEESGKETKKKDEDDFSSKAQVMTLMTTDVDRVAEFSWHLFTIVDAPIELLVGTVFLYDMLGVSCFIGLAATVLFLPMNHFGGKVVVGAQDNLMKTRDERVSLMNEILGAIRMLKFMAWERSFESRVHKIRAKELKYQKLTYTIEVLWNAVWNATPIFVTLVSFYHFAIIRGQPLTPSIAFTSISVFTEMKFALNAVPETLINMLQSLISARRIEKYLNGAEVKPVPPLDGQHRPISVQSATITWPQDRLRGASSAPSVAATPKNKFVLLDLNLEFPVGELSLVCGKLGSGKTLLLLALLGEADVLTGQVVAPRSPPDALASFVNASIPDEEWVVPGMCAFVPQTAWLRNASIRDNILFNLPYNEERYQRTLAVCALLSDLQILEDGDQSEIGERGVNLSGGQKARVSLARAVYSRASIILLDDVLSAVDAHTAHHLFEECLKGDLMKGRTVILVSHHVQLCAPGASYIVALDNGRVQFQGGRDEFRSSGVLASLSQSTTAGADAEDDKEEAAKVPTVEEELQVADHEKGVSEVTATGESSETSSTVAATTNGSVLPKIEKKAPRKLIEEEKRAVGHIGKDIWLTYFKACGGVGFWIAFISSLVLAALSPVAENGWLRVWSGAALEGSPAHSPLYYIGIYALINMIGLVFTTLRYFILYRGGLHASKVLYHRLLEGVLFANIRFHDTVSRGRLLNRFGKDFEGIDSTLPDNFGRSVMFGLSAMTTVITVSVIGGIPFVLAALVLGSIYYNVGKVYGQTSRDMRRLDSVTRSPLYSIYGETIAGVAVIRSFGASSKFLRDMLRCVDTNINPYYWMWGVNRWLSARFDLLSSVIMGVTAIIAVGSPTISAATAGFALAFTNTITSDLLFMIRRFVGLEQSMVAVERVKEFSEVPREPPEFIEPRPPASWPTSGHIAVEDLVIRYAPDLPPVLHHLTFEIKPGEKVGILGRTGSGKSTLALSFFRFVEPTEGRILVDGLDISKIGLTDLRSRLTIIPQDPTILSGTVRSTLDVFNEYEDAEIYEALRRVHLIPSEDTPEEEEGTTNANMFRNLDSPVSEGGENFSTGEKQLLCMARAILKRTKVLLMDEATASVDYATDELIGKTIRHEFAQSTILTIAHRLRTIIDYDRIMLLDEGRIVEFDKPATLLRDTSSKFYALCKATGKTELAMLRKLAGV